MSHSSLFFLQEQSFQRVIETVPPGVRTYASERQPVADSNTRRVAMLDAHSGTASASSSVGNETASAAPSKTLATREYKKTIADAIVNVTTLATVRS